MECSHEDLMSKIVSILLLLSLPFKGKTLTNPVVSAFSTSAQFSTMSKRSRTLDSELSRQESTKRLKRVETVASESPDEVTITPSNTLESQKSVERTPYVRDEVIPRPVPEGSETIKIMSWNVNGLRAVTSKNLLILEKLVEKHQPDILCFQETKLQEDSVGEFVDLLPAYSSVWSCSTVKKGYSGTAVFFRKGLISLPSSFATPAIETVTAPQPITSKKKQQSLTKFLQRSNTSPPASVVDDQRERRVEAVPPTRTSPRLEVKNVFRDFENWNKAHVGEGRTITVEFEKFFLIACYVPNSGEGLVRLNYRLSEWDPHMTKYITFLQERKPVIFTGDLNVGHLDLDIHNPEAKHIVKQAGLTPQERASFSNLLAQTGCRDAFRFFHSESKGQFTYWSQRTFARPVNRGIRLDYFICSQSLFEQSHETEGNLVKTAPLGDALPSIFDSYILQDDTVGCSDHCPVVLVLKL